MERKELIEKAKELGFTKAHTMKTVDLEKIVNEVPEKGNGTGKTGRKINPNSARQQRLQAIQDRINNGEEIKRGRPVVENSERQKRLAERQAQIEQYGEIKRGRRVDENSARQQRLKDLEARRASGELRRGRPKKQTEQDVSLIDMLKEKGA